MAENIVGKGESALPAISFHFPQYLNTLLIKLDLNPFPNKQTFFFMWLQYRSFVNIAGKEDIAHNEQFLLFSQCFLPYWKTLPYFHQI